MKMAALGIMRAEYDEESERHRDEFRVVELFWWMVGIVLSVAVGVVIAINSGA